jgi:hypothetical protein
MGIAYNPKTVTDGLVLCLDAANPKSYPGSGTVWNDLSGNGNNANIIGAPIHSGNYFSFNGIDQYAVINSQLKNKINSSNEFTIIVAAKVKFIEHVDNLVGWGNANNDAGGVSRTFGIYSQSGTLRSIYNGGAVFGSSNLYNTWLYFVSRYDLSNSYADLYGAVSNSQVAALTPTSTWKDISITYDITVCKTSYFTRLMEADVSQILAYDRKLSNIEITDNFNSFKGRIDQ